jgi:hypothetical protein
MIVDTSALVAVPYREPEAQAFVERIHAAEVCRTSVANSVELSMAIESQLGPGGMRQAEAFFRRAGAPDRTAWRGSPPPCAAPQGPASRRAHRRRRIRSPRRVRRRSDRLRPARRLR